MSETLQNIRIGLIALQRGMITGERFVAAMSELAARGELPAELLWTGVGMLSPGVVAALRSDLAAPAGPERLAAGHDGPAPGRSGQAANPLAAAPAGRDTRMLYGDAARPAAEAPAAAPAFAETMVFYGGDAARPPPVSPRSSAGGVEAVDGAAPTSVVSVSSAGEVVAAPAGSNPVVPVMAARWTAPQGSGFLSRPGGEPQPTLPEGEAVIAGRYRALALLGRGGLGQVLACEDTVLGRVVAVKVTNSDGNVARGEAEAILEREARIVSRLEHPHIIPVYDAGRDRQRGQFYVMRRENHLSLDQVLRLRGERHPDAAEYTLGRLLRYFAQICHAVDYAHSRGVVHCDLKPANILLGGFGEVLVVDWGLAQIADSGAVVRGGTLGYMAPEQRDPRTTRLDARADLFALGAVLYEILCGRPAFAPAREASRDPGRAPSEGAPAGPIPLDYEPPPPPRPAVEGAEIDAELEALCMQALALAPERRLSSARQLAEAIDGFLEGTRERARRRSEAERSATAGDELAERYHELVEAHPEQVANVAALRAATAPWAAIEDKQELWDAEDMLRVTEALRVRTLQAAVSTYEHALDAVSNHGRARAGLARLYWSELQRARDDRNAQEQVYFEQLLRQHDDGRLVAELTREGVLEVHLGDAPVTVTLAPVIEDQRRLVCGPREELRRRPLERRMLAPGTYLVTARAPGGLEICWPVHLRPGAHCRVPADLVTTVALAADEVFVPAGAALLCGDPLSSEFSVQVTVDVPAFVLQRVPVTFAAWFAFLDALRQGEPAAVETHLPRSSLGSPYFRLDGDRWRPDHIRAVVADPDPQRLPVMGVSARSAEAYALWLAQRTGRRWRLPQENEWEKAGRGTDGRIYPWGDHFDATFCKMRDSRPGPPSPEPVASYPADVSPYGVCDMAGGVAEWCLPDPRLASRCEPGEVVSRGGAWCDWPIDCRLASRRRYIATERAARVGLRLARDP